MAGTFFDISITPPSRITRPITCSGIHHPFMILYYNNSQQNPPFHDHTGQVIPPQQTETAGPYLLKHPHDTSLLSASGASLHIASFMMDTTRHYMTHGASFIFTFEVCHARESHVILVFYGRRGTSYCLRIIAISATPFAVCHKVIKIAPNRLSDKDNLSKNQCHCLLPENDKQGNEKKHCFIW